METEPQKPDSELSQNELSQKRTGMSEHRTGLSEHRTDMSEHRTEMSEHRTELSEERTGMSEKRTGLSEHRTQLSDVRSHLANERTHLSYLRTGISLISFGVTLNRFSLFLLENRETYRLRGRSLLHDTESAGIYMVILGCVLLVWSVFHFIKTAKSIDNLSFSPSKWSIIVFSTLIIVVGTYATVWMMLE